MARNIRKEKELRAQSTAIARDILTYNRNRIYKLSVNKYPDLYRVVRGEQGKFLLDVINFWLNRSGCLRTILGGKPVFFLGTHKGTYSVRKKMTRDVTNRWLNYLCAVGLLNKEEQRIDYSSRRRYLRRVTGVNKNMLRYNPNLKMRGINTFKVEKYTTELLCECNENAKKLYEHNITAGNISYNQLALNGLKDIALRVYQKDKTFAEEKKLRELAKVESCIDYLIELNGYTTKQEIYDNLDISDSEIDKVFKIFKTKLWENRTYKAPTKAEQEKYGLQDRKWIIQNKPV